MRTSISSAGAPRAVGSYSQAVKAGPFLFLSGQVCENPETGVLEQDTVAMQTRRILQNIKAIVTEAGGTLDDVVSCQVFISDMKHFAEFDAVYHEIFSAPYPARVTVATAGIYDNLDIEITATVYLP